MMPDFQNFTIKIEAPKHEGILWYVTSDDIPGLMIAGRTRADAIRKSAEAIEALHEFYESQSKGDAA